MSGFLIISEPLCYHNKLHNHNTTGCSIISNKEIYKLIHEQKIEMDDAKNVQIYANIKTNNCNKTR